ncbi:MAG: glycine--tRNA ligase [Candidatus Bathyarchaeia archaeon]
MGDKYDEILRISKRRGFLWPSFEIYGGLSGFVSFGYVGTLLKHKVESLWRRTFIENFGFLEIETPLITPARVLEASGHVDHFRDPIVACQKCQRRYKADSLVKEQTDLVAEELTIGELGEAIASKGVRCPQCGGGLSKPKYFRTMFETKIGPYTEARGFGRPEAAQAMFVAFKRYYEHARKRLPFGVGQVGRVLRNEISPRQGPIRLREFTIMEVELFFDPQRPECDRLDEVKDDSIRILTKDMQTAGQMEPMEETVTEALRSGHITGDWLAYFMAIAQRFLVSLGVPRKMQRFREHLPNERAHYSLQTFDQEVLLERWGWVEVSGHSNRGDYDLRRHMEFSGVDMRIPSEGGKEVIPQVIEPSFGSERIVYCVLEYSYSKKDDRTIMRIPREVSPIQIAVFPLVVKDELPRKAQEIHDMLSREGFNVTYDEGGSIGRRYARADEIGVPIAVTVDYETLSEGSVTLRDRDTWKQVRRKIDDLSKVLRDYFSRRAEIF